MKLADKLPPKELQLLNRATSTIVNQVNSLKHMVDDFKEYARRPQQVMESVDFNALVDEVLTLYGWDPSGYPHAEPGATQARLEVSLAEGLPTTLGDPTQLRQVIHNLLANARDALVDRAGDGVIEVKTQLATSKGPDGADQHALRLTVSDNGPGFSTQILNRAFEPYITTKAHGTGLGLAIVRKIIEEHGGHIDISNRKEGGARVSILLTRLAGQLDGMQQQNDNKRT